MPGRVALWRVALTLIAPRPVPDISGWVRDGESSGRVSRTAGPWPPHHPG